jgi:signal transduction histidine kinase
MLPSKPKYSVIQIDAESQPQDSGISLALREAITNATRHDGAKELTLTMALNKENLMVTLNDDLGISGVNRGGGQTNVAVLESRSLSQRLRIVKGHAFSAGLKEGRLLAVNIPLDFTENE